MKKFLLSLLLVFPLCGFAQKGMQGFGGGFIMSFGDFDEPIYMYDLYDKRLPSGINFTRRSGSGVFFRYEYNLHNRIGLSSNIAVMNVGEYSANTLYVQKALDTPNCPPKLTNVYELVEQNVSYSLSLVSLGLDLRFFLNGVRPLRTYMFCGIDLNMSLYQPKNGEYCNLGTRGGFGLYWRLGHNYALQLELPVYITQVEHDQNIIFDSPNEAVYCVDKFPNTVYLPYNENGKEYDDYYEFVVAERFARIYFSAFTPTLSIVYTF